MKITSYLYYQFPFEAFFDVPSEVKLLICSGMVPDRVFSRTEKIERSDNDPISD